MTEVDRREIRVRRAQMMLTQEELAERAGVAARTVRDIETGRTKHPRPSTVRLLLDALTVAERESNDSAVPGIRPRELPMDTFGFTGREEHLAELDRHHATAVRIVTLSGTAGVGKTALAIHWAHRRADHFPDGQLYLNLRGYDPAHPVAPSEALAASLRSLGVAGPDIPPNQDDRARQYRTLLADRRMLVVLDNALDVDQVRDLLPGTPTCFVLVTSRDSLGGLAVHHGGQHVEVHPLSQQEAEALLRVQIGARAVQAPQATAALAQHCARLPLALRIAAQRATARPAVTLADLAAELTDEQHRLDLLDSGEPHSSAHAVFTWSYRQLPESTARLFRLLGVHPGRDIDLHALAALADVDLSQARRETSLLTRAHLVEEIARDRFGMHDLLRMYAIRQARSQDSSEERDAALTRLFDYYVDAAIRAMAEFAPYERHRPEQTTAALPPIDSLPAAVAWLDAERANLIAVALHGWSHYTSRLSGVLHRYLSLDAHVNDAALLHGAALDAADADGNRPGLVNYGGVLFRMGRLQEAMEHNRRALVVLRATGGRREEGRVLGNQALVYSRLGRHEEAVALNEQSLVIFREVGDLYLEAVMMGNLGLVHQRIGNYQESSEIQRRVLTLYQEFDDLHGEAAVRSNLGVTCSRLGRHEEALRHHHRALTIHRRIGYRQHEAETLNDIGTTLRLLGSPAEAIERHRQALARTEEIGDRCEQARAHEGIAHAHRDLGDIEAARTHLRTALELHKELGTLQAAQLATTLAELDAQNPRVQRA